MAKRKMAVIALSLFLCLCLLPCSAYAASTESIDTSKHCTLSLSYRCGGVAVPNMAVKLYRIADVSPDFQYSLTPSFSSSNLNLNGIKSQSEWNSVRSTLEVKIIINKVEADFSGTSNENGLVNFGSLTPGLYLAISDAVVQHDVSIIFDSALIALPNLVEGKWNYNVTAAPKPIELPPIDPDGDTEYKVLKLWKGDENKNTRPKSIEIDIFRSGTKQETIKLSEENNWSYSWLAKDDGTKWHVAESTVPSGYTETIDVRQNVFIITNTLDSDTSANDVPIKTGDTSNIMFYIVLMCLSGSMMLLFGIAGMRKRS